MGNTVLGEDCIYTVIPDSVALLAVSPAFRIAGSKESIGFKSFGFLAYERVQTEMRTQNIVGEPGTVCSPVMIGTVVYIFVAVSVQNGKYIYIRASSQHVPESV